MHLNRIIAVMTEISIAREFNEMVVLTNGKGVWRLEEGVLTIEVGVFGSISGYMMDQCRI